MVGDEPGMELTADPVASRGREHGRDADLDERETTSIHETIDQEVLVGQDTFRSTRAEVDGSRVHAEGELTLVGQTRPIVADLTISDAGELSGSVVVKQSDWGMKPYSALFGALKVKDGSSWCSRAISSPGRRSGRRARPRRPAAEGPSRGRRARCPRSS